MISKWSINSFTNVNLVDSATQIRDSVIDQEHCENKQTIYKFLLGLSDDSEAVKYSIQRCLVNAGNMISLMS
jgi:hypothetical protein